MSWYQKEESECTLAKVLKMCMSVHESYSVNSQYGNYVILICAFSSTLYIYVVLFAPQILCTCSLHIVVSVLVVIAQWWH